MTSLKSPVVVETLPGTFNEMQGTKLFHEMQSRMDLERPRIVFDCTNLRQLDKPVIHLMLCCLEEAMKRNGDVKLACLPAGAGAILDLTGVNHVFDIYVTTPEAVNSFYQLPSSPSQPTTLPTLDPHSKPKSGAQ